MMGSAVVALAIGLSIQAAPTRLLVLRVPRTPDEGRIALHRAHSIAFPRISGVLWANVACSSATRP
jgi:hypothetical protein